MRYVLALVLGTMFCGVAQAFPWFASGEGIRGADLMQPQERRDYVDKLRTMRSRDQCESFWQAHNAELDRRARQRHEQLPPILGDPCQVMQIMGRFDR
jgi:hypothetical protein